MTTASVDLIQRYLACSTCKEKLDASTDDRYACASCDRRFEVKNHVFVAKPLGPSHYFDNKHLVMEEGNASPEILTLCYSQQSRLASALIEPGNVVVDIGCGPTVHYERPPDSVLIGIDPSFDSIRLNSKLDIRVFANAQAIPIPNRSVDRIFFFYSIHHMIGETVEASKANVIVALRECGRVIRDGGTVVVFDMSPWWLAWLVQRMIWNRARQIFADKLDMFFWRESFLIELAKRAFTEKSFESSTFSASPFLVFPPLFSEPNLKIPRFLYPFDIKMYKWSF